MEELVEDAKASGARVVAGGNRFSPNGAAPHKAFCRPQRHFRRRDHPFARVDFQKEIERPDSTELDFEIAQPALHLTNHTPPLRTGKNGFFYEPTILADVQEGVRIVDEEQFGPVMPLIKYTDVDDALVRDIFMTKACSYDLDVFFLMAFGGCCVLGMV